MAVKVFGFKIGRDNEEENKKKLQSFASPEKDDGALVLEPGAMAGAYGAFLDIEGSAKNEAELVTRYREMAIYPECEYAIDDIVNEAIITDEHRPSVSIVLDNLDQPESIKTKIRDCFDSITRLLEFKEQSYDIFRRWYVDGRVYYHIIIDVENPRKGIQELRPIDPRKIRLVREVQKDARYQGNGNESSIITKAHEYFVFNEKGIYAGQGKGLKISKDSICYAHSGLLDSRKKMVISHLHKAIKPFNQLRMLEDSVVIYRISRAPERRIFYIDVGNLPKVKAEQYLKDIMTKFKNKLIYDSATGTIRDEREHRTMLEDYWLPRREGGRGTEITTLPGGQNLGEIEDIQYFQKKLFKSLNVPISRLEPETGFSLGRAAEINRDEVKFSKFIARMRTRFTHVFLNLLQTDLRLKGIITQEDWNEIKDGIQFNFLKNAHFAELQETELLRNRVEMLRDIEEYKGTYYSGEWIRKNVLMQTDEDIKMIDKQIKKEGSDEEENGDALEGPPTPAAAPSADPQPTPQPIAASPASSRNGNSSNFL